MLDNKKSKNKSAYILRLGLIVMALCGAAYYMVQPPPMAGSLEWEYRNVEFWNVRSYDRRFWHKDAVKYCQQLELNGHFDWRLPKLDELQVLLDYSSRQRQNVAQVDRAIYWTATPYDEAGQRYWALSFLSDQASAMEEHNYNSVVCVRGSLD